MGNLRPPIVALALAATLALTATGEAAAQRQPPPPAGGDEGLDAPPTPEEIREAMEHLMIVRMKKALALTADQEQRVVPLMEQLLETRRSHAARRREDLARLYRLSKDVAVGDEELTRALRDLDAAQQDFRRKEEGLITALNQDLGPRQRARLLIFEERFRRQMQRRVQEAIGRRGGRPAGAYGPGQEGAPPGGRMGRGPGGAPPPPGRPPAGPPPPPYGEDPLDDPGEEPEDGF